MGREGEVEGRRGKRRAKGAKDNRGYGRGYGRGKGGWRHWCRRGILVSAHRDGGSQLWWQCSADRCPVHRLVT